MSKNPKIDALSKFEWTIMNELWELENASARDIIDALPENSQRAYTTIQTYLERLVEKGYLSKKKAGNVNLYQTVIPRDEIVDGATNSFIERVFQGSGSSLAAYLIKNKQLRKDDLEQIRQILEEGDDDA
ncbi:MAG: BlaI/MecI/CopY family transcriptional regulator [Candidatus Marinimicrobia bacterium]|nr:BlaI/MecI/CopY family transcriptional regulator [Candidatus Neomarinimicrobiota bacterium]MCF7905074.1 BlaI/MecI/CopY family transcriptional regulator [Candidatus Neomarinimicrobiota bacterium]